MAGERTLAAGVGTSSGDQVTIETGEPDEFVECNGDWHPAE